MSNGVKLSPNRKKKMYLYLSTAKRKIFAFLFVLNYFKFYTWNTHKQQFDSNNFDWLGCGILWGYNLVAILSFTWKYILKMKREMQEVNGDFQLGLVWFLCLMALNIIDNFGPSSREDLLHKSYITFVIDPLLMMAQSQAESTRDTFNYRQYINQFLLNMIKAIREYERIQKKICRQKMSIMFNEICIYICIYIYIYNSTNSHLKIIKY